MMATFSRERNWLSINANCASRKVSGILGACISGGLWHSLSLAFAGRLQIESGKAVINQIRISAVDTFQCA